MEKPGLNGAGDAETTVSFARARFTSMTRMDSS